DSYGLRCSAHALTVACLEADPLLVLGHHRYLLSGYSLAQSDSATIAPLGPGRPLGYRQRTRCSYRGIERASDNAGAVGGERLGCNSRSRGGPLHILEHHHEHETGTREPN